LACLLFQVLASLKNQIEQQVATRKDSPELITAAQHYLLTRETTLRAPGQIHMFLFLHHMYEWRMKMRENGFRIFGWREI